MNSFLVVFVAALAVAQAGVITHSGLISETIVAPGVKSTIVQGPSSSAHIIGPDGSQIIAHAPGAAIHATEQVGIAADVIAPVAYSAPLAVAHAAPVAYAAAPVAYSHAAPVAYAAAPVVHHSVVATPLTASGYPLLAAGSGIEGQYVHDITEQLFDDGSYKGELVY